MNDKLMAEERMLILKFADKLDDQTAGVLRTDLEGAYVAHRTDDKSLTIFGISNYKRPLYGGQHTYEVEGTMQDVDGAQLSVLLHADSDGHLLELELLRWDNAPINGPKWDSLKLY
ncbi:hypothetical protein A167_00434 [Alcanivorax sp. S71-1-4]|uniref:DUF6984 family protein n=1 Tax=Alcanivorax sp. S71-1-4 TaxID=1177159 RepID=UPI00135B8358|nr:hypothetical protein [Alcanivorax sp. S71-1-4]KAF0810947.1 hypothetical protein A167_00434 [Alcanivorax sp. S71-1-4]